MNDNERAVINSKFVESPSDRDVVWTIIQARYSAPAEAVGGFEGSAFLIDVTSDNLIFVTAGHCLSEELFTPKTKNVATFVWLANGALAIPITVANRVVGDNDVSFLVIPTATVPGGSVLRGVKLDPEADPVGKSVFNLGFPNRGHAGNHLRIDNLSDPVSVTFAKGPWRQDGHVERKIRVNVNADVKMTDGHAFLLDYTSEPGFSGGPLMLAGTDLAIGMMSMVMPNDGAPPTESIAVAAREILEQKNRLVR